MEEIVLIKDDLELNEAFELILSKENYSDIITDIAELIYNKQLEKTKIEELLREHDIERLEDIKEEILDLLIAYINIVLNDHKISEKEATNLKILKRFFKIKEGDFYKYRYKEVEEILQRQLEIIYRNDNKIDTVEAIFKVGLQEIFDLSYDQFLDFNKNEVKDALDRGANLRELDTVYKLPFTTENFSDIAKRSIQKDVMNLVRKRDSGKCVECGSYEKIEFNHIVPLSNGGTNTYRNVQLLCEECNRKKNNQVGE